MFLNHIFKIFSLILMYFYCTFVISRNEKKNFSRFVFRNLNEIETIFKFYVTESILETFNFKYSANWET